MSPTQIEEENKEETRNEPLVTDSGATAHYHPTAFDEKSLNDGRSQVTERVIVEFKRELNEAILSVGTLV